MMRRALVGFVLLATTADAAVTVHLLSTASLFQPRATAAVQPAGGTCNESGAQNYTYLAATTTANSSGTSQAFTPPNSSAVPCFFQHGTDNTYLVWVTPPLSASFTISATPSAIVSGAESAAQLNAGADILVYKWDGRRGGITALIWDSATSGEWNGSTCAAEAAITTSTTFNSTSVVAGDRLIIIPRTQNVGSFAANGSRTASICYNGAVAGANELSITFDETLTFSADAAGPTTSEWLL